MQVIGSVFSGAGKDGDFDWMITQDHYKDALFVFNDNEAQYKAHRDRPTDLAGAGCAPGGGTPLFVHINARPRLARPASQPDQITTVSRPK